MSVTQELFRQAWGKFATGVSIVTTIQEDGRVHQMTANALCSVSLDPPLLLLCVGHQRSTYHNLKLSSRFGVNILARGQDEVASRHSLSNPEHGEPGSTPLRFTPSGAAALPGSLAFLDCRVVAEHLAGDHSIFVAEVEHVEVEPGAPLLFYEGRYASLDEG